ncbi:hypothetical protein IAR50_005850 [Cryptococcus sp. DSM 104548]
MSPSKPFQPPTRPHSANPLSFHPALPIFSARPTIPRGASTSSFSNAPARASRDGVEDWEDAWDSSSDKEDGIINNPRARRSEEPAAIAGSWASTSYTHVGYPSTSPTRPTLQQAKTYSEGTSGPAPGTGASGPRASSSGPGVGGSKLPPGGAWEIVEADEVEEDVIPVKVGKEAVREDVEDILKGSLSRPNLPGLSPSFSLVICYIPILALQLHPVIPHRHARANSHNALAVSWWLLGGDGDGGGVDLGELRRLAWSGVPQEVRPIVWQLLLNYLPLPAEPRLATLSRKRREYEQLVDQYFGRGIAALDQQIWHQIEIDVPRTRPGVVLWSCETTQRSLEKILYVWAIRHPASGYVQGINDLVTPFFEVFLSAYISTDPELFDPAHLPARILTAICADSFWCLTKLLDSIQDHYISHQPGIQRLVRRMGELVKRIDAPLAAHFEEQGVEFMQFAFRWMNCLLMREISGKCTVRMWDTYLAEGTDAFSQFHLYVCSALLVKYSERLREMDFQEMIIFLQRLPTQHWSDHDIELLLSEAYVLKTVWQGAENHFKDLPPGGGGGFGMLGR